MFVMFVGFLPVNGETEDKIRRQQSRIHKVINILPPEYKMSPELTDLVKRILTIDPNQRITLNEAMRHRWITGSAESVASEKKRSRQLSIGQQQTASGLSDFNLEAKKHEDIRVAGYTRSTLPVKFQEARQRERTSVRRKRSKGCRSQTLCLLCLMMSIIVALLVVIVVVLFFVPL